MRAKHGTLDLPERTSNSTLSDGGPLTAGAIARTKDLNMNSAADAVKRHWQLIPEAERDGTRYADKAAWLHEWASVFIDRFGLAIPVPVVKLGILPRNSIGHVCAGICEWSDHPKVVLNARYVAGLPEWELLGELLHQLVHVIHAADGDRDLMSHAGKEWQIAEQLGLDFVGWNHAPVYLADSPFKAVLRAKGVAVPSGAVGPRDLSASEKCLRKEATLHMRFFCYCVDLLESCPVCTNVVCRQTEFQRLHSVGAK